MEEAQPQMIVNNRIVNSPLYKGGAYVSNGLIVKLTHSNDTEQLSQIAQ